MIGRRLIMAVLLFSAANSSAAFAEESSRAALDLPTDVPHYEIRRVVDPIKVDGLLDEPAWFAAPAVGPFHFPWHAQGSREQTAAKLLWDDDYLYIAHVASDAHITARHTNHDDPIAEDDCFEIMFAPDPGNPRQYFNIEWNVHGGYVDGHRPEGPSGPRAEWAIEGLRIAGTFSGTLNNDRDVDRWWTGEVAIPFASLAQWMPQSPPRPGSSWRINLNRHGGDTNLQYSQWSPGDTPQPAFHTPHRFGVVRFVQQESPP